MFRVTFYEDGRHRLSSFVAAGHVPIPETSPDKYSMVCAAASAILQAAAGGLTDHAKVEIERQMSKGILRVSWPRAARADVAVQAIISTAFLALKQIAKQYPKFVRVTRRRETG
jgi:uncharacterized protein YsxB (DUF464 family)